MADSDYQTILPNKNNINDSSDNDNLEYSDVQPEGNNASQQPKGGTLKNIKTSQKGNAEYSDVSPKSSNNKSENIKGGTLKNVQKKTEAETSYIDVAPTASNNQNANSKGGTLKNAKRIVEPNSNNNDSPKSHEDEYELNGKKYKFIKVISEETSEAQIFLVERKNNMYVLKLYYYGNGPADKGILEKLKNSQGSGLLVDIIDYGVWQNPQRDTEKRDYELMTYCQGGSLAQINLNGNEKRLCELAVRMAASIDFCHKHGFIHRDIKPENFFFYDKEQTQLMLADFGISVPLNNKGIAQTNQDRTVIYAAPEVYWAVGNTIEIGPKSDFYSLGMTLLCLWMSEKSFKEKEFELIKRKQSGDIPMPPEMSDRTISLIKALTIPLPENRCGFDEIVRWAKGENVFEELTTKKDGKHRFNIIFNAGKDEIAHSPEQLAELMRGEPDLAKKYLYSGKISKWLTDNLRPELTAYIEDIVEKSYPKDQEAGLSAACFCLDPDMPYYDVTGAALTTNKEIADSIINNFDDYQKRLCNPNDSLFIFFNSHGLGTLAKRISERFKKHPDDSRNVLWQLIYTLDPDMPFHVEDDEGEWYKCDTTDQVINTYYQIAASDESWDDLHKEAFLIWLGNRDKGLLSKVKETLEGIKDYEEAATSWAVIYNLNPYVSYTLQLDENEDDYIFTHTDLARMFNQELMTYNEKDEEDPEYKDADYSLDQLLDIEDTRLYFYLKSKGIYDDKIDWIKYCFELDSKDNTKKSGPYEWGNALFKMVKGLGEQPFYHFKNCNKTITSLDELKNIPQKEIKGELKDGFLKEFISVFFQEDPALDLTPKFEYEKATVKYVEFIESLDKDDTDVKNYHIAADDMIEAWKKLKGHYRSFTILQIVLAIITFVPILGLSGALCYYGLPFTGNPLEGFSSSIIIMGIILSIIFFVMTDFETLIGSGIIGFIVAAVLYYGAYFALGLLMPFAHFIIAGLLIILGIYLFKTCYLDLPSKRIKNKHLLNPGFEERYLEPLHFAFRAEDGATFDSSISDETTGYDEYLTSSLKKLIKRSVCAIILILGIGYLFFKFNKVENYDLTPGSDYAVLKGEWTGNFGNNAATFEINDCNSKSLNGIMHVKFRNITNEKVIGKVNLDKGTISFKDVVANNILDGSYSGTFTDKEHNSFKGEYQNPATGKKIAFSFTKQTADKNTTTEPKQSEQKVNNKQTLSTEKAEEKATETEQNTANDDKIVQENTPINQSPTFKGLEQFLKKNIRYPENAKRDGIEGTVQVSFTVEKDGSIINPRIYKSVNSELDREALRLVLIMPKWSPAYSNGEAISEQCILPIEFKIQ